MVVVRLLAARKRIAWQLRKYADRIDPAGAPKYTHWTFTFERGRGLVFREDGKGMPCLVLRRQRLLARS